MKPLINMSIYRIKSSAFSANDEDFVVAKDLASAISCYLEKYQLNSEDINLIEKISDKCLVSEK